MDRACLRCGALISACMGFSLARDWVSGRIPIREMCGKCVEGLEAVGQSEQYLRELDNGQVANVD